MHLPVHQTLHLPVQLTVQLTVPSVAVSAPDVTPTSAPTSAADSAADSAPDFTPHSAAHSSALRANEASEMLRQNMQQQLAIIETVRIARECARDGRKASSGKLWDTTASGGTVQYSSAGIETLPLRCSLRCSLPQCLTAMFPASLPH